MSSYSPSFIKKVDSLTALLFIIAMLVTLLFKELNVWDATIISLGFSIAIRQYLIGKVIDIFAAIIISGLIFVLYYIYQCDLGIYILLLIAALYITPIQHRSATNR